MSFSFIPIDIIVIENSSKPLIISMENIGLNESYEEKMYI